MEPTGGDAACECSAPQNTPWQGRYAKGVPQIQEGGGWSPVIFYSRCIPKIEV